MQPITAHTGRTIVLRRNDVDTDQIIPAEFCKRLTKNGYADALFAHWRKEPGFALDDPNRADATVLVAGSNFGTGSSREHAVWALHDWGFRVVVAESFGDIFLRNAWKNGLLAVALPSAELAHVAARAEADAAYTVTIDLVARELRAGAGRWPFPVEDNARQLLLDGLDDIDVTLRQQDAIGVFERGRSAWLPALTRGAVTAAAS